MRCVIVDDQGIVPYNASFEACQWIRTDFDAKENCKDAYDYFDTCMMYHQDNFTCLVNISESKYFSKYIQCSVNRH